MSWAADADADVDGDAVAEDSAEDGAAGERDGRERLGIMEMKTVRRREPPSVEYRTLAAIGSPSIFLRRCAPGAPSRRETEHENRLIDKFLLSDCCLDARIFTN